VLRSAAIAERPSPGGAPIHTSRVSRRWPEACSDLRGGLPIVAPRPHPGQADAEGWMAKYSKASSRTVKSAMSRRKKGTLKSGSGGTVKSRKQAIAIGLSEAREKGQ